MRGEDKGGCKMVNSCNTSWRGEGGEGFRTVECLRGRLLAERVASRAAKEDSENSAKRLTELERMMAAEIKARNNAEKRLKNALKKLESLNLIEFPGLSEISKDILVENQLDSSSGSNPCLEMAERKKSCSHSQDFTAKEEERNKSRERLLDNCFSADSTNQSATQETSWSSAGSSDSVNKSGNVQENDSDSTIFFRYNSVLAGDSTRRSPHDYHVQRDEHEDGNSETVPASFWSETSEVPIKSNAHDEKIKPDVESKRSFSESLTNDKISKGVLLTVGELKAYFEHLVTVKEPLQTTGPRSETN